MAVKVWFRPHSGRAGKWRAVIKHLGQHRSKVVPTKRAGWEWGQAEAARIEAEQKNRSRLMYSKGSNDYLEDCAVWMRPQTVNEKFTHFTLFAEHMGADVPMDSVTVEQARKFHRSLVKSRTNKTANNIRKNLHALWNWHMKEGRVRGNPWSKVSRAPEDEVVEYVPPREDVLAVRLAAEPWEQDFLDFLLLTGARPGEPRRITWPEVNFDREYLLLWTRKRKGGEKQYRRIAMPRPDPGNNVPGRLWSMLRRRWDRRDKSSPYVFTNPRTGTAYTRQAHPIKYMMTRLIERAEEAAQRKIPYFDLYALRHYVTLRILDSEKGSLTDAQLMLGHSRPTTTDRYAKRLSPDTSRGAAILDEDEFAEQNGAYDGAQKAGGAKKKG